MTSLLWLKSKQKQITSINSHWAKILSSPGTEYGFRHMRFCQLWQRWWTNMSFKIQVSLVELCRKTPQRALWLAYGDWSHSDWKRKGGGTWTCIGIERITTLSVIYNRSKPPKKKKKRGRGRAERGKNEQDRETKKIEKGMWWEKETIKLSFFQN